MPGIGILLNPHSKKHRHDPDRMENMAFIIGDKGSCKQTADLEDLRRVAEEFKTRDIEILGIGGGDGTIHTTLTNFIQIYGEKPLPKLAFLKGGTLNTLATSCGIKGSPEKNLSDLIYKYHEDIPFQMKQVDILNINGEYGFIFGTGVLFRFMEEYYAGVPSPFRAATTLTRAIGSALVNGSFARSLFERYEAEVEVDGEKWPYKNYSALYASSVEQLGLGFRAFHYSEEPGKFHAIGFSMLPRSLLPLVPYMFLGKPSGSPNILEAPVSEMKMKFELPQGYIIDGDRKKPASEIILKVGPRLNVLVA